MNREQIVAYLNLYAVLPRLEELVKLDDEARQLAESLDLTLHFRVKDGPTLLLEIRHGVVRTSRTISGLCDVGFYFPSYEQLNKMFRGEKKFITLPYTLAPHRVLGKIKELKTFMKLMDILPRYLKPTDAALSDPVFAKKYVEMAFMVGLCGTREVADHDPKMKKVVGHLKDGTMLFKVMPDGPFFNVTVRGKVITVANGPLDNPSATVEMRDVKFAIDMLNDRVDTFAATGAGDLRATGALALVDEYNALLDRASYFLAKM